MLTRTSAASLGSVSSQQGRLPQGGLFLSQPLRVRPINGFPVNGPRLFDADFFATIGERTDLMTERPAKRLQVVAAQRPASETCPEESAWERNVVSSEERLSMMDSRHALEKIRRRLADRRRELLQHAVYEYLQTPSSMRIFMQHHVFAVWDFMSLLKSLQQRVCCVSVPWLAPKNPSAARFVNEIVLGEETDEDGKGGHASHFELYLRSMRQFQVDTGCIDRFSEALAEQVPVAEALRLAAANASIQDFVLQTFRLIDSGDVCSMAAAFTFGREDLLPDVFQRIVDRLDQGSDGRLQEFKFYLLRHIELDGDQHGPMAENLIATLCGSDSARWRAAENAAAGALEARKVLWDGTLQAILNAEV